MDLEDDDQQEKPQERNTKRREPQLAFDADGFAVGWNYEVMRAFRPALDIVLSERVKTITLENGEKVKKRYQLWTEGDPPMYSFRENDAVSSREKTGNGVARFLAQVTQASPDKLDGRVIVPGVLGFRFFEWQPGNPGGYHELGWFRCTQAEFVDLLIRGGRPPVSAVADPRMTNEQG